MLAFQISSLKYILSWKKKILAKLHKPKLCVLPKCLFFIQKYNVILPFQRPKHITQYYLRKRNIILPVYSNPTVWDAL